MSAALNITGIKRVEVHRPQTGPWHHERSWSVGGSVPSIWGHREEKRREIRLVRFASCLDFLFDTCALSFTKRTLLSF